MSVLDKTDLDGLVARVADLGRASEEDARAIIGEIYDDGVVSRAEADAMFELNNRLSGSDAFWDQRFREAIRDFLLTVEAPVGWVSEEECSWLMDRISRDGEIRISTEIDLLLDVLRYAEGAPARLGTFALGAACDHAVSKGRVSAEDVERIRRAIYAGASEGATWVSRSEAEQLFKLNDVLAFTRNDKSWNDLFARAIGNYLMASAHPNPQTEGEALSREKWLEAESKGVGEFFGRAAASLTDGTWFSKVTYSSKKAAEARIAAQAAALKAAEEIIPEEDDWLVRRLGWDKTISPAERALIDFLKTEAPGFTVGIATAA